MRAHEAQRAEELGPDARWWQTLDNTHDRAHEAWPEITTVAVVEYPWDTHLTMRWELEPDIPAAAETQTTASEAQLQDRDEQADWLRLN